jgi:mRNA-degrading endonuclease RelE of RelBE toxin-antitoxin system
MKDLAASAAALDIKALRGELDGFYRLRVGHYRVIYHHGSGRTVFLDYADLRDEIYEAFRRLRALGESEEG